jgi:hypothetical protein
MNEKQNRQFGKSLRWRILALGSGSLMLTLGSLLSVRAAAGQEPVQGEVVPVAATTQSSVESTSPKLDAHGVEKSGEPPVNRDESLWPILKDFYPERFAQLRALRERDPHKFAQVEREMRPWLHQLREARTQNPELARLMVQQHRLEMEIHEWQNRYRAANDEQRKTMLERARTLAETRVDLRLQRDRLRMQWLEKRLHNLKADLAERETRKSKAIEREIDVMTSPAMRPATRPAP